MLFIINAILNTEGRLTETQWSTLATYANEMVNMLSKIEASYLSYYNNDKLSDGSKTLLKQLFDDFKIKHTNYTNSILIDMKDRLFSMEERKIFNVRLTEYRESRSKLNAQIIVCINEINSATNDLNFQQIESRLNEKILNVQNQINTINNQITTINNKISSIESRLDSLENNTNG